MLFLNKTQKEGNKTTNTIKGCLTSALDGFSSLSLASANCIQSESDTFFHSLQENIVKICFRIFLSLTLLFPWFVCFRISNQTLSVCFHACHLL
jgi:hypothetical protein